MAETAKEGGIFKTVYDMRPYLSPTDHCVMRAHLAQMEVIRRRFRAIWFTDARRFVSTLHFQELGAEFWLHEKWLLRLGFLEDDEKQLPGMNTALLGQVGAEQDGFTPEVRLVKDGSGVNELRLFIPQLVAKFRLSPADWVTMREEEQRFGSCCFKLQRYLQIAFEGGMMWEDLLTGEAVQSQLLGKDNKMKYCVPNKEVFITRVETIPDVAAMHLSCGWSTTGPSEDMYFVVEVQASGAITEDLVMGSFNPCSVLIWNGRYLKREQFPEAVEDICTRNLADIVFLFNTGMNGDGILKGMDTKLPFDAEFWMPEEGQGGGVTVLWNSSKVNLMCGSWKVGPVCKTCISLISSYAEEEPW